MCVCPSTYTQSKAGSSSEWSKKCNKKQVLAKVATYPATSKAVLHGVGRNTSSKRTEWDKWSLGWVGGFWSISNDIISQTVQEVSASVLLSLLHYLALINKYLCLWEIAVQLANQCLLYYSQLPKSVGNKLHYPSVTERSPHMLPHS